MTNSLLKRVLCFMKLAGTRNYYQGIDKPTFWQWLFKWRLSVKTAWKVSKIIYDTKEEAEQFKQSNI